MKIWHVIVLMVVVVALGVAVNVLYVRSKTEDAVKRAEAISSETAKSADRRLDSLEKSVIASLRTASLDTIEALDTRLRDIGNSLATQIQNGSSMTSAEVANRVNAMEISINARIDRFASASGQSPSATEFGRSPRDGVVVYGYRIESDEVVFEFDPRDYEWTTRDVTGEWSGMHDVSVEEVNVAGEFNSWSKDQWNLQRIGDNRFVLRKKLSDLGGQLDQQFKFVINHVLWVEPPTIAANRASTGFADKAYNFILRIQSTGPTP